MDNLLDRGATCVTVLDVSAAGLERARTRLGATSEAVQWIQADVTDENPLPIVDIWHDRAVFHFLTGSADRSRYVTALERSLKPGGQAIIATFALDGPEKCSGLPIVRYSARTLSEALGVEFQLVESVHEHHRTPSGDIQSYVYARFARHP